MTEIEYRKWLKRIHSSCKKYRISKFEIDIAHDIFLKWAEGMGQHSTIDQMVIDQIRLKFGRTGFKSRDAKYNLEMGISNQIVVALADGLAHLYEQKGSDWTSAIEARVDTMKLLNKLTKFQALLLELYFLDGYTNYEIAQFWGCDESNVSLTIRGILKILKLHVDGVKKIG